MAGCNMVHHVMRTPHKRNYMKGKAYWTGGGNPGGECIPMSLLFLVDVLERVVQKWRDGEEAVWDKDDGRVWVQVSP